MARWCAALRSFCSSLTTLANGRRWLLGIALCLSSYGCARSDACVLSLSAALTNATLEPQVPLSAAQQAAIGAILSPTGELKCTGTLIAARWVLTAAHCAGPGLDEALVFRAALAADSVSVPVVRRFAHPQLDAMLLELPPNERLRSLEVAPLRVSREPAEAQLGATLTLVGFGETEAHTQGTRGYLQEKVVSVDASVLVVDGGSEHGACTGDSGGPLLATSGTGEVAQVGLLSNGNASCRGLDRYLRVDLLTEWLQSVQAQRAASPCADSSWEGSCASGRAEWCDGEQLQAEDCVAAQACGWDVSASGYRCVEESADPCLGISASGSCSDSSHLLKCAHGELVSSDCEACGQRCAWTASGSAECL